MYAYNMEQCPECSNDLTRVGDLDRGTVFECFECGYTYCRTVILNPRERQRRFSDFPGLQLRDGTEPEYCSKCKGTMERIEELQSDENPYLPLKTHAYVYECEDCGHLDKWFRPDPTGTALTTNAP